MKMSELIAAYGDERVEFQNLDHSLVAFDYGAKKGTTITFGTQASISPTKGTQKLGLVIWLDRERVAEILAASKGGTDE